MEDLTKALQPFIPVILAVIAYYSTHKIVRDKEKSKSKVYEWKEMYEQQKKIIELNERQVIELMDNNKVLEQRIKELESELRGQNNDTKNNRRR